MAIRRNLTLLALLTLFLWIGAACAVASESAPPLAEEPAAPAEPAEEEPAAEEPLAQPTMLPLPTATLAVIPPNVGGSAPEAQPAILESRRLTLEFPPVMRTGDGTIIRMTLEMDDQGNIVPTAVVEGNVVTGEVVEIPDLYETHNVIAEARLDLAGMEVQPAGTISQSLLPGHSITFYWSVRPKDAGNYAGMAWLHLRFLPKNGGEEMRIPVSIQFLEIRAESFLGFLSGGAARGVGALGSVLGSVLGFPFIDDFVKWLWAKIKRK